MAVEYTIKQLKNIDEELDLSLVSSRKYSVEEITVIRAAIINTLTPYHIFAPEVDYGPSPDEITINLLENLETE
jgi:hypothetical protein